MSRFNLAKKLLPAKKAWKSFETSFQSKLQKLNTSKAIKRTKRYCINTLNSIRVFIPCKLRALIYRSPPRSRHHFYHYHQHRNCSSAVYVDELFPGHGSTHAGHYSLLAQPPEPEQIVTSSSSSGNKAKPKETTSDAVKQHHQIAAPGEKILEKNNKAGETSTGVAIGNAAASAALPIATPNAAEAWKIPLLPQLRCVDERAEEFISKVRQEMNLEREQSIIDFQEMLARGT